MPRPAGTSEQKLSLTQLQAVVSQVVVPAEVQRKELPEIFYRFSEGKASCGKKHLKEFVWILKPIFGVSPVRPVHCESLEAILHELFRGRPEDIMCLGYD
ncbi:unnamed protein product, partial [Effrenium voratum]